MSRKMFVLFSVLLAVAVFLSACGPSQQEFNAMQTQVASYPTLTPTMSVEQLQATIVALTTPEAQYTFTPTPNVVASAASATPSADTGAHNPELGSPIVWQNFPQTEQGMLDLLNSHCDPGEEVNGCYVLKLGDLSPTKVGGRAVEWYWDKVDENQWTLISNVSPLMQDGFLKSGNMRSVCARTPAEVLKYGQPKDHEFTGVPANVVNAPVWGFTFRETETRYGYGFPHAIQDRNSACLLQHAK